SPSIIRLEERGVVTACHVATYDPEPLIELQSVFAEHQIVSKVIMKSEWLKEAFSELDSTSTTLSLLVSPAPPYFRLSAAGLAGEAQMDYPKDTDVLESFYCSGPATHQYKFALLQPCLKALACSSKTSIRVNERGFLSLQVDIRVGCGVGEAGSVCLQLSSCREVGGRL
ncbi:Rad1/Rec1/Rad17, partial [Blyttiomyces helicus]